MSRHDDLLAAARAALDEGGARGLRAHLAGLTRDELEEVAVALGTIEATMRAADALATLRRMEVPGRDDPLLRDDGEDWQAHEVAAWVAKQARISRTLVELARAPGELVAAVAEPAERGGLLDDAVRAQVAHLFVEGVVGALDLDAARRWAARFARTRDVARSEEAAGLREREHEEPREGFDGDGRMALASLLFAAAEGGL